MHTLRSDGAWEPHELLAEVRRRRLVWWAITDHDTDRGWRELGPQEGLIPGVEVSSWTMQREVHLSCLGCDPEHAAWQELLRGIRAWRQRRARHLMTWVNKLSGREIDVAPTLTQHEVVTRSHLANLLIEVGLVEHRREAFDAYLGDDRVPHDRSDTLPAAAEVAEIVRDAGGVCLLAHPGMYKDIQVVEQLLDGLDGLEVRHGGCSRHLSKLFVDLAHKRGLLMSCGSDFHGPWPCRIGDWRLSREEMHPLLDRLGLA